MKNNEVKPPERYAEPAERLTNSKHTKTRVRIFDRVWSTDPRFKRVSTGQRSARSEEAFT